MSGGWRSPAFWWQARPSLAARLLSPLGLVYGAVTAARMERKSRACPPVPVICIGNLTAGGSGKTPFALALAGLLADEGEQPVFLTRGYGGRLSGSEPVQVDPRHHTAAEVGDEALLLARCRPTVICPDRVAGARLAGTLGSPILMDDGFQNPSLKKTVSLVLVDAATGIGNGQCLPAGPLRAPVSRQLPHADAVVVIGAGTQAEPVRTAARDRGLPVFGARLETSNGAMVEGLSVLAFSGIGRPAKFVESLIGAGAKVAEQRFFGDHHAFREAEAQQLLDTAQAGGLRLVTTSKDHVRLGGAQGSALNELATNSLVLEVEMRIAEPAGLVALLLDRIAAFRA
ncbi:tetraacyldisaccharide 4'-kinase [Stappia sp.]|uniref:tetraacyldisaccharide 4'-kinase n=1 Tax=Stappia sp. TaxID=1870903 RepID=UPI003A9941B4